MIELTKLSYDWLLEHGWHRLERLERQPTDHVRRCVGREVTGRRFLVASEDLCIDMAPEREVNPAFWFCWVTRASAQNRHPSVWLHVRHLHWCEEVEHLYEGLTGRQFGKPTYDWREMPPEMFPEPSEGDV